MHNFHLVLSATKGYVCLILLTATGALFIILVPLLALLELMDSGAEKMAGKILSRITGSFGLSRWFRTFHVDVHAVNHCGESVSNCYEVKTVCADIAQISALRRAVRGGYSQIRVTEIHEVHHA